jgi:hypothetical protein
MRSWDCLSGLWAHPYHREPVLSSLQCPPTTRASWTILAMVQCHPTTRESWTNPRARKPGLVASWIRTRDRRETGRIVDQSSDMFEKSYVLFYTVQLVTFVLFPKQQCVAQARTEHPCTGLASATKSTSRGSTCVQREKKKPPYKREVQQSKTESPCRRANVRYRRASHSDPTVGEA